MFLFVTILAVMLALGALIVWLSSRNPDDDVQVDVIDILSLTKTPEPTSPPEVTIAPRSTPIPKTIGDLINEETIALQAKPRKPKQRQVKVSPEVLAIYSEPKVDHVDAPKKHHPRKQKSRPTDNAQKHQVSHKK